MSSCFDFDVNAIGANDYATGFVCPQDLCTNAGEGVQHVTTRVTILVAGAY